MIFLCPDIGDYPTILSRVEPVYTLHASRYTPVVTRQSLLNATPRSQMMPYFTFPLHKYDSKKRLNRQQVLLRLAPTLVKVNDLTPLRQEFSNSAPKIFGVEYTDSTLEYCDIDTVCLCQYNLFLVIKV